MKAIKPFFIICMLMQSIYCIGQSTESIDPNKYKPSIPTSPEVATLGKFGDVPVGLYTGVPNITIPLYSLKIKDFELPISLSYNSSGIKVEELATNTGLGWALNAGGSISCSVNGLPDFGPNGFAIPSGPQNTLPSGYLGDTSFDFDYNQSDGSGGNNYIFAKAVADGEADSQPDLFYYSFVNKSGKFYTDQHRQFHTMPFVPIKITRDIANNTFKITDEQGVIYTFASFDSSTMGNNCGAPIVNASALLTKIQLTDGNIIYFNYTPISYAYNIQPSATRKVAVPGNYPPAIFDCTNSVNNSINVSGSRLSEITSTLGHDIKFVYNNNRTDLPGTQSLDSLIIKNPNKVIDSYVFNYGYFGSGSADYTRLKLVSIRNANGAQHNFTYNESVPLAYLAGRLSFAQDHWGYFNGKTNNTTLFPIDYEHGFFDGADREADSVYSQLYMLKQIAYPTGGYTKFTYEQNDYYFTGNENTYTTSSYSAYGQDNQNITTSFSIPAGTNVVAANVNFDDGSGSSNSGGGLGNQQENQATTITINGSNGFSQTYYNGLSPNHQTGITLNPGNYTISVNNQGTVNGAYCTVTMIIGTSQYVEKNKLLGGLRIKNTLSRSSATSNEEYTQYVYRQQNYPLRSSGNINFLPQYTYTSHRFFYRIDNNDSDPTAACRNTYQTPYYVDFYQQATNSVYPVGAIKGGSTGYNFVTTLYGSAAQNGKTESTFTFAPVYGAGVISPIVPVVVNDWRGGLLTKEVQYRNQGGIFQPIILTQNTYSIQPESVFWNSFYDPATYQSDAYFRGLGVGIEYKRDERLCAATKFPAMFRSNTFRYVSEWVRPDSIYTTNYTYDNSGALAGTLFTSKYFTYNNPAHMLPSITTTQNSKGATIQTTRYYPQDYATGTSAALDSLVAQHRISTSIQSQVNNNSSVQATNFVYRVWNNSIVEPEYVQSKQNNLGFENRVQFFNYDNKANPIAESQFNGPQSTYLWGCNKQYPIAEVKNAPYNLVYTALANSGINADNLANQAVISTTDVANIRTAITNALPNAQITTYTYEPLVGITSMTDPKGMTMYYEYDSFQRLINVKDKDGNVVKHLDYHYANQ